MKTSLKNIVQTYAGCIANALMLSCKSKFHLQAQQLLLHAWHPFSLLLFGIITFRALLFYSPIFILAAPFAIRKNNEPSLTNIPKRSLHSILHYLLLQQIKNSKHPSSTSSFPQKRHRYFLFQYYKNFQLISRLKGSALCLLQTQYAKKPKNPI